MTIVYCDFTNGDDSTGDGSSGNPYKTITQASTGLTGGDEVRVAKSPSDTALTGTLGFTAGSTAVTGSGTLFTTELAIGDFVKGGDGQYYEIVTITDNTNAVLYKKYPGTTESGVTGYKLGVTSTGEAAATSTAVQTVSSSGSSTASRLKISGGWDLGTTTQNGQTYFRQMHSTFANRYGRGLYASSKDYIEIERLHFLRYDNCIYMSSCDNWKVTSASLLSAGDEAWYLSSCLSNEIITPVVNSSADIGIYFYSGSNNTITTPICNSNSNHGIYIYSAFNNTITTPTCNSNKYGIYLNSGSNNTITTPTCNNNSFCGIYMAYTSNNTITTSTCNSNSNYGIYMSYSSNNTITTPTCNINQNGIYMSNYSDNNTITTPTCNNNSNYGIRLYSSSNNTINKYSGTGNSSGDVYTEPGKHYGDYPCAKCQHFKTSGDNRCYYEYGVTYRDTANARSTQCLKYSPTSATYYISQSFFFKADSGVEQTLSAYIKKDTSFGNGDVQGAIYFMGERITGWTEITPSVPDTYEQKSLTASSTDITEDGVLELRIKCRSIAGNIFVDDLSTA